MNTSRSGSLATYKASLQASAWDHLSTCLESVESNLNAGQRRIDRTWKGGAAANARTRTDGWTTALGAQSDACSTMASHLRDMVDQAVQMAQVVVDIIKTVVSLVSAALSSAYIPGWGQWKAIKTVRQGIKMVNDVGKVITVFWNAITMVKDGIIMIANHFSITALPPAPAAGADRDYRPCPSPRTLTTRSLRPERSCSAPSPARDKFSTESGRRRSTRPRSGPSCNGMLCPDYSAQTCNDWRNTSSKARRVGQKCSMAPLPTHTSSADIWNE